MTRIMSNEPPNLSVMIVKRMFESVNRCKTDSNKWKLPYGKLTSRMCKKKCEIPKDEIPDNSGAKRVLNVQSIQQFEWKWDARKEWVRKK